MSQIATPENPLTSFLMESQFYVQLKKSDSCINNLEYVVYPSDYYGQLDSSSDPICSVGKGKLC